MRLHLGKGAFDGERLLPAALMANCMRRESTTPRRATAEFGEA